MSSDPFQDAQSPTRRTAKKNAIDGLESRRARGEIACAECRRLKLKCDRRVPCSSCVRRGCPSICPNGSLASGQGTRYVLADTSQLHAKINEMGQRIRQLEDALAISQSSLSNEPHPLLREEMLSIKFGPERHATASINHSQKVSESLNVPGTLTFGEHGEAKYFGRSAGAEALLLTGADIDDDLPEEDPSQSPHREIMHLSSLFPLSFPSEDGPERSLKLLYSHLPQRPRAWSLCETYLEHVSWQSSPIRRSEIVHDVLTPIYRNLEQAQISDEFYTAISPHKLAVLFIIFSLGALADLTLEPFSIEAENYFQLGRAALTLHPLFDSQELSTVQAIILMANYHNMAGRRYTMDSGWCINSLGSKLAQSIGLHRDSARWNLDTTIVQRRRSLFYEVFCVEMVHSLALGRPPGIRMSYVDCEFPTDEEVPVDQDGKPLVGFYQWKYEFCRDILSQVIELTLTAEPPNYQTVLDLDRKVREKTLPSHLNMFMNPGDEHCTPSTYMRGCLLGQFRAYTLLYIHRSFFAQAMLDHPLNPLRSPYAPSFLAAYRCASGIIKSSQQHYERFPALCARWWMVWTHLFSAAIIVGTIVTHSPSSTMTPNAYAELSLACTLFEKANHSRRARSAMQILTKLRDKATQIYSQFRSGNPLPLTLNSVGHDYGDDELALFGGQTKVVFSKLLASQSKRRKKPTASTASSPSGDIDLPAAESETSNSPGLPEALQEVHPSLLEWFSLLPPSQQPHAFQPVAQPSMPSFFSQPTDFPTNLSYNGQESQNPNYAGVMSPDQSYETLQDNDMDLGMVMSGNAGIDEQWKSLMRNSGILGYIPTYSS
ncbi:hypothetical protein E1B28_004456 [Marasmius oreades]|uniref:Zn(2)-C6 fungal-type domain-containing protein n=1 Tax=Marasmius oreades TaxID=181124 RepID=A0A9P7UYL3_9AGAR|nr:uncharacterized protein E1B28_004456 [Marasmius oreades]KAG7097069.1 hypothetical protein E1B28_004456 [Marasmius oreades]